MRTGKAAAVAAGIGMLVAGCSSGSSGEPADSVARPSASAVSAAPELPGYSADLSRVCADGLGFPGLPAYERKSKGVHPAVMMRRTKAGDWALESLAAGDYPQDWIIDYADDVAKTQLVTCFEQTGTAPAGKVCRMEDNKTKKPLKVTMYNTTWLLRVLDARTGKAIYQRKGRAASTTCPMLTFTSANDDPTKFFTVAQPTDYRGVLKKFIAIG